MYRLKPFVQSFILIGAIAFASLVLTANDTSNADQDSSLSTDGTNPVCTFLLRGQQAELPQIESAVINCSGSKSISIRIAPVLRRFQPMFAGKQNLFHSCSCDVPQRVAPFACTRVTFL